MNGSFKWTDGSPIDYYSWHHAYPCCFHHKELATFLVTDKMNNSDLKIGNWLNLPGAEIMRAFVCKKPVK